MAAPNWNLTGTQILLTSGASVLGVISQYNTTGFGVVAKVSDLCDRVIVGDNVNYEIGKIIDRFVYGSTIYILINEENVSGVEIAPP